MISALCSFCPQFHNITHKTEAVLCIAFLNSTETIKLQQLVDLRMNQFIEKGEIETEGNIFSSLDNMAPWVNETLVKGDHHAKDKEMSDIELEEIQG